MEKTRLTLDDLQVQSFATTASPASQRGTVRGHDLPTDQVECPTADPNWNTCWASCNDTDCCGSGSGGDGGGSGDCTYYCGSDWCGSWTFLITWC